LVMYDLVSTMSKEGWKRPIYFTSVSGYDFKGLNDYLELEGLVYRFVPIRGGSSSRQPLRVNQHKLYSNIVKNYGYYGMKEKENFFLDDKASYVPNDIQQMGLLLAKFYVQKVNVLEQVQKQLNAGSDLTKMVSPEEGFVNAAEFFAVYSDSMEVYRNRGVEVLNHVMKEIPESVMPMRREYRVDYGLTLLSLGDEKGAKKVMDQCLKENLEYYNFFVNELEDDGEGMAFAQREIYVSEDLLRRMIKSLDAAGKKALADEYRKQAASIGKF
jgi:tetratricopeptide (TPR) repeat protein